MSTFEPPPDEVDAIIIRNDFDVEIVEVAGSDQLICQAARVSTVGADSLGTQESGGLINFLMRNRHGSPFEHGMMTFRIQGPIAMWREYMRHRIGFSYNEQSARYMELEPVFYLPPPFRNLQQIGKPGEYEFVPGTEQQQYMMTVNLVKSYKTAWVSYQNQLKFGIAKEVARFCLPVGIYSTAYVTCNPRSIMSFLSLRTDRGDAMFPSKPQWEISQVAMQMEILFSHQFPLTHAAFNKNGRVSP